MNSSLAQLGEGVSGQSHGSLSSVGGPSGNTLSIYAGGFANTPQIQMSVLQSNIDALGSPSVAQQEVTNEQNLDADEETFISLGGGHFNHISGGLSSVQGLGTSFSNAWNSHDETDDEDAIDNEAEKD
ncbi:unnamed protein product [Orchesella dallaii]|uniref:Uncharacterized protein n=1 Tax=Orchesella dallaii TaxID=48710 RepID=A0ABP1QAM1_9HEXA